ncbi:MAG: hypothetical protein WA964_16830, partial [Ilumatobacter sp.]
PPAGAAPLQPLNAPSPVGGTPTALPPPVAPSGATDVVEDPVAESGGRRGRSLVAWLVAAGVAALALIGAIVLFGGGDEPEDPDLTPVESVDG